MANILAVDDNIELCKLIRTALERDGHRVETRLSGAELTEQLWKHSQKSLWEKQISANLILSLKIGRVRAVTRFLKKSTMN